MGNFRRIGFVLSSIGMVAVSLYLSIHYYQAHFPGALGMDIDGNGGLCNLSSFWNCDAATYSPFSQVAGIPIALFGLATGLYLLCFALVGFSNTWNFAIYWLSLVNLLGCLGLGAYSLSSLGSLCPGCTIYYSCSCLAFLFCMGMDRKFRSLSQGLVLTGLLLFAGSTGVGFVLDQSFSKSSDGMVDSYRSYIKNTANIEPLMTSYQGRAYLAQGAQPSRSNAEIRVAIFSDFQCPGCKYVAEEVVPKLGRIYKGRIHIELFDSPMDPECNPTVPSNMTGHALACQAAFLAHCGSKNAIEDIDQEIFDLQGRMTSASLQGLANKYKLSSCLYSNEVRSLVSRDLNIANQIQIPGTPTIIINGITLASPLPIKPLMTFIDLVLEHEKSLHLEKNSG